MTASHIQALFQSAPAGSAGVATVTDARDGQAVTIDLSGTPIPVAGHLSQVEALHTGDRVLTLRTEAGVIVAGRLRAANEAPAPRLEAADGRLRLEAPESVRLQAGDHRIEVHADGRIEIDGRLITGHARERIRLQGATIELN
jgi:hypothetical protein